MTIADQLINDCLTEKFAKGQYLTGKQVAALSPKQHIFVDGKKAIVVAVNVDFKMKNAELVYVKGRKAFGKEISLVLPFNDMKTNIQLGVPEN